jgi:hypothetical protein
MLDQRLRAGAGIDRERRDSLATVLAFDPANMATAGMRKGGNSHRGLHVGTASDKQDNARREFA